MINHALIEVSKLDVNGSSHKLSTIDVTIASGAASLFGTGALLITTSSIRKTILHIILIYSASCFLCVCKRENKGPCTRIRISLNAQLFLSGIKKISTSTRIRIQIEFARPHVSGGFVCLIHRTWGRKQYPERKSCGFKDSRIRVDGAWVFILTREKTEV